MREVHALQQRAASNPDVRAVHRLRKAIRRCRSMADGLRAVDPAPEWKAMLRTGRGMFRSLGGLRDTHVLIEWLERIAPDNDPVAMALRYHLDAREVDLAGRARAALAHFDGDEWQGWIERLAHRAERHPPGGPLFEHLAMQRLVEARELHRRALKGGSKVAWHRLRIGIKKLRYPVENFLPELHARWGETLARLQELLGDVHDLDVLWDELVAAHLLDEPTVRATWTQRIGTLREARVSAYRDLMVGPGSRWPAWESELLADGRVNAAVAAAVGSWAEHHGSDQVLGERLADAVATALDDLRDAAPGSPIDWTLACRVARGTARLHGLAADRGRRQVLTRLAELPLPLGWSETERVCCAHAVAQFHRPRFCELPGFETLTPPARRTTRLLTALLGWCAATDDGENHARLPATLRDGEGNRVRQCYLDRVAAEISVD